MRRLINRSLGSDYEVIEADDGATALQLAEHGDINLLIYDLGLPYTDPSLTGMRLLYRLHGILGPLVPIVVVSGGDLTEVYETGLFRSLPKPFTPAPIRKVVSDLIASSDGGSAALVAATVDEQPKPRPWWMALFGILLFVSGLMLQWQAQAPATVWVSMCTFSLLLMWVGPTPADAAAIFTKIWKGKD